MAYESFTNRLCFRNAAHRVFHVQESVAHTDQAFIGMEFDQRGVVIVAVNTLFALDENTFA